MDFMKFAEHSIGLYHHKDQSYKYLNKKSTDWKVGFLILYVLYALTEIINSVLYPSEEFNMLLLILGIIILGFIGLIISSFIGYGLIYLFMRLFGGKATFTDTVKLGFAIAILPAIIGLVLSVFPMDGGVIELFVTIVFLVFSIWAFVLSVMLYSKLHKISILRSFFALILPIAVLAVITLVIAVLLFATVLSSFV